MNIGYWLQTSFSGYLGQIIVYYIVLFISSTIINCAPLVIVYVFPKMVPFDYIKLLLKISNTVSFIISFSLFIYLVLFDKDPYLAEASRMLSSGDRAGAMALYGSGVYLFFIIDIIVFIFSIVQVIYSGTPVPDPMTCANCGATLEAGARFCRKCGTLAAIATTHPFSPPPANAPDPSQQ